MVGMTAQEVDRRCTYALQLLDREPIGDGGHPAERIERAAKTAGVRVEQVRAALHRRMGA